MEPTPEKHAAPAPEGQARQVVQPQLATDRRGATTLEWALLVGAIALPSYAILQAALGTLVAYFQMMTAVNSLPVP